MDAQELDEIIARHAAPEGRLLGILSEVQDHEGYIPRDALVLIAEKLDIRMSQLYSLVTFYSFFSLQPVGKHVITICMGTACHVRGAETLLSALEDLLGITGEVSPDGRIFVTTGDRMFTVGIARCFGACSMAPVLQVDGNLHGYVKPESLPALLAGYGWRGHED